jgi:hypothetical protein
MRQFFETKNWKTTSAGLLSCSGALVHLGFAIAHGTLTETMVISEITTFIIGIGFIFSRDGNKSDEQVGAGNKPNNNGL